MMKESHEVRQFCFSSVSSYRFTKINTFWGYGMEVDFKKMWNY
jgi:hypothetical protein